MQTLFTLSNLIVLPFWLCMIGFPAHRFTQRVMHSQLMFVPLALLYTWLLIPAVPTLMPTLMNPQLPDLMRLLSSESGTTVAWIHFLTFDLFVGRWMYHTMQQQGMHHIVLRFCLLFTFMAGPFGLLLHLLVTWLNRHTTWFRTLPNR